MSKIILYSQPDCPPCEVTKKFLKEYGFLYTEKNIKVDKQARNELINKYESYSTPTVVIEDHVIRGFDLKELKDLLNIKED
ncbi:glutaredoxin family protein [Bacillus sp. 1NLA3E]|uniref:glutaredoxin family protein n=1 Tax=Bacillus sp. 1NLA3E TaxID=666686 RepID=UPI000247EF47|nr:glutaredoxin family protein [Bacillus sp. 1NLA3E]AGK52895.1 glutaredoxin family protein [Bacillus sp. 1NLA3E]